MSKLINIQIDPYVLEVHLGRREERLQISVKADQNDCIIIRVRLIKQPNDSKPLEEPSPKSPT